MEQGNLTGQSLVFVGETPGYWLRDNFRKLKQQKRETEPEVVLEYSQLAPDAGQREVSLGLQGLTQIGALLEMYFES